MFVLDYPTRRRWVCTWVWGGGDCARIAVTLQLNQNVKTVDIIKSLADSCVM